MNSQNQENCDGAFRGALFAGRWSNTVDVNLCEFFVRHVLDGVNGSGFRRREREIPFEPDEFRAREADGYMLLIAGLRLGCYTARRGMRFAMASI